MASQTKYMNQWERLHARYERYAYKVYKSVFNEWGRNIPWNELNENNYESLILKSLNTELLNEANTKVYENVGKAYGMKIGKSINNELKAFTPLKFNTLFQMSIQQYLVAYGSKKVVTVSQTYAQNMNNIFNTMLSKEMNIKDVTNAVHKQVNKKSFYKWQALRIARTETTAAANFSASVASNVSGYVMEKMWLSARDERTRDAHRMANGTKVLQDESFEVGGELLPYPGSPNGSAGNVINCRCTIAIVAKRDKDGYLIPSEGYVPPMPKPIEVAKPEDLIINDIDIKFIRTYTGGEYKQINNYLNTGDVKLKGGYSNYYETKKEIDEVVKGISTGLKKIPDTPGTTYRGMRFDTVVEYEAFMLKLKKKNVKFPAFTSTSTLKQVADDFKSFNKSLFIEIEGLTGKDIKQYSGIRTENEVLFDLNSRFKVASIAEDNIKKTAIVKLIQIR